MRQLVARIDQLESSLRTKETLLESCRLLLGKSEVQRAALEQQRNEAIEALRSVRCEQHNLRQCVHMIIEATMHLANPQHIMFNEKAVQSYLQNLRQTPGTKTD